MARGKKKRSLIIAITVLAVLLVAIGIIAIVNGMKGKEKDPFVQKEQSTSSTSDTNKSENTKPAENDTSKNGGSSKDADAESLDPSTLATITIEPMNLVVSYVKGAGGFSYEVNRTADGRRFVAFSSESLAGTKCTDDAGVFVSILESPNENEKATISKTTVVDGKTYGLSVASNTCTSDSTALQKYQDSFSKAFTLLKKAE